MPQPPLPQSQIPLQPMRDGKPPKYRLKSAADAQTLVANLWQANAQRNLRWAAIEGQIEGNPPFSPTKMRAQGRASDPNFNTLEAKALLSTALVPYYDLFAGQNRYVEIRTDFGNDRQQHEWSGIMSAEYDRLLRRWDNFEFEMQKMLRDYIAFGRGVLRWNSPHDWRFSKIAFYRVMVPDSTSIDLDRLELVVMLQDWNVAELYGKIRDEKAARSLGWDIRETLDAIESAVPTDPASPMDPIASQQMLRDNDLYTSARSNTVQTATLFVREYDNTWSECMVRRDQIPTDNPNTDQPPVSYMFESRGRYKTVLDTCVPFFYEVLDGSWNGASGLGRDIFTLMQLKDRLACNLAQAAMLRGSLVLQPRQALDRQRMNLVQIGAVTWIPEGVEALQSSVLGDITTPIEVARELSMMTERNTGIYRPTLEKGPGNPQTLGEFQSKFAQATALSSSAVNRFYSQLDRFYTAQCRRVIAARGGDGERDPEWLSEARQFKKRCTDQGVPDEAFDKIESVRAWRSLGQGSAALREQKLFGLLQTVYPLMRDHGREALLRDVINVTGSHAQEERYMPGDDWTPLPSDDAELATLENNGFAQGGHALWTPSQNNIIHAQTHLQFASQAASSLQQGGDPHEVLRALDSVGAHIPIHLQHAQSDPTNKDSVKLLTAQWKQLAGVADKLRKHLQETAQQQQDLKQRAQDTLTDQQIKMMETQGKLQLSREKAAKTLDLKAQRQQAELALKARQMAGQHALSDADTAAGIARENAKTSAEIARKRFSAFESNGKGE